MGILKKRKQSRLLKDNYDLDLIEKTQPHGNLDFRSADRYYIGGDGYYTILNVYDYPSESLRNGWQSELMEIEGASSLLSVYKEDNKFLQKKAKSAVEEKSTRMRSNSKILDISQEEKEILNLDSIHKDIVNKNIAVESIYNRIFITANTVEKLFEKVEDIKDRLSAYKMTVLSGELDLEQVTPFVSPSKQIKMPNRRRGATLKASALAGGYFFNHSKLEDERGFYTGYTSSSGIVNFDFLERTNRRTRSFMMIAGNTKMGQSTFCHKVLDDMFARGQFIRNFDVEGSYIDQTEKQNGLILSMSNSDNRINLFQVFPTATTKDGLNVDEVSSFQMHVEKLKNIFKMLNSSVTGDDMQIFEETINDFYIAQDLWFKNPEKHRSELRVTQLENDECLILSDFVQFLNFPIGKAKSNGDQIKSESLQRIKRTFNSLLQTHANIFEGVTKFQNISSEQVVTFDFSGIKEQKSILNAQLFSALSFISSDITNNGKRGRYLMKEKGVRERDILHYIVNIPDTNYLITPQFPEGVEQLSNIIDNMGDNFSGVILNFKSLQGVLFEGQNNNYDPYTTSIRKIVSKMQYRVFAQVDDTEIGLLDTALANSISKSEITSMTTLEKNELFMNISAVKNIRFKQHLMDDDRERYGEFI